MKESFGRMIDSISLGLCGIATGGNEWSRSNQAPGLLESPVTA